jgi:uncharacterized protein
VTLLAGVLVASLLGSVHCGAMCSVFACIANGGAQRGAWYHAGRLMGYVALGTIAGVAGAGLDTAGMMANVQRTAALVTSVMLVLWGLVQLRQAMRARRFAGASSWGGVLARLVSHTDGWDPRARATTIGLATALLPCAWLWAFIATAMGTGSPVRSAIVMAVFWAGTVPMLTAIAAGARRWAPAARVRWPIVSASLVMVLGLGELTSHLLMPPMRSETRSVMHMHVTMQ